MEDEEMLDTTNETENTDNSSVEENEEVELTDGREVEEDGLDNQDQNSEETNQEDVNSTQKKRNLIRQCKRDCHVKKLTFKENTTENILKLIVYYPLDLKVKI